MVVLNVKHEEQTLFLFDTKLTTRGSDLNKELVNIFNMVNRIKRLGDELELLLQHGVVKEPEEKRGDEQTVDQKIVDKVAVDKMNESQFNRVGQKFEDNFATDKVARVLAELRTSINITTLIKANMTMDYSKLVYNLASAKEAVDQLLPQGLPENDPLLVLLDQDQSLEGDLDSHNTQLWFANRQLDDDELLSDRMGTNEKSKVIIKLSTVQKGRPMATRMSEEEQHRLMAMQQRRMEELAILERDQDNQYLTAQWADGQSLKKSFQAIGDVKFKPS